MHHPFPCAPLQRFALFLALVLLSAVVHAERKATAPKEDYAAVFGEHWTGALAYAEEQRVLWDSVFARYDVDPLVAESVIFPELVRFSTFRDRIERATMRRLYAHGGSEKGNFSIGVFQMKATFAERLETLWMQTDYPETYDLRFDLRDEIHIRKARLERLCSEEWQCVYLALFLRLVPGLYPQCQRLDVEDKVVFLATAYNYSFAVPYEQIQRESNIPRYHTDFVATEHTVYHSYADIALSRYRMLAGAEAHPRERRVRTAKR